MAWRRENLADLSGRVLEIGAGIGTNFALYPSTVTDVIAVEPERRLTEMARAAAKSAAVPVTVTDRTIEMFDPGEPFDAAVCSLVLCRVDKPDKVLRHVFSLLRPASELRYLECRQRWHAGAAAATGWRDGVAAPVRQLSHAPRHRGCDRRCRVRPADRPP